MTAVRGQRHARFQQERVASASTPEDRFAAAYDWFRSSVRKLGRRRAVSPVARMSEFTARERLLREAAEYLERLAAAIDRGECP